MHSSNELKIMKHIFQTYELARLYTSENSKTMLRKSRTAGIELVASKPIKRGERVAFYKVKVYRYADGAKMYRDSMYAILVPTISDNDSGTLIGDLYSGSLCMPGPDGVTYLGFYANEPNHKQSTNVSLNSEIAMNYKDRKRVSPGDTYTYSLRATRDIKKNEAIVWCYGDSYHRDYAPNAECLP